MVKHVLHVPKQPVLDTLEWRLWMNNNGSVTMECRELGVPDGANGWNCVVSVGTDGRLYQHEYIGTNLLHLTETRAAEMVVGWKPSWNTNVEELKNHYGKLVTAQTGSGMYHGLLSESGTVGVVFVGAWKGAFTNIKKFCVHELPED